MDKQPVKYEDDEEAEVRRWVRAGLDGPARPLRGDEIESLVVRAFARRADLFPAGLLLVLALGPLVIAGLGWFSSGNWNEVLTLALLIPLANLALSPLAAWLVLKDKKES